VIIVWVVGGRGRVTVWLTKGPALVTCSSTCVHHTAAARIVALPSFSHPLFDYTTLVVAVCGGHQPPLFCRPCRRCRRRSLHVVVALRHSQSLVLSNFTPYLNPRLPARQISTMGKHTFHIGHPAAPHDTRGLPLNKRGGTFHPSLATAGRPFPFL